LLLGSPNPTPDTFHDDVSLKFGNCGHNRKHGFSERAARVYILLVGNKLDAEMPKFIERRNQVLCRTGEPIKSPTKHTVKKSFSRIFHQGIQRLKRGEGKPETGKDYIFTGPEEGFLNLNYLPEKIW
jgi:hypothetical protein